MKIPPISAGNTPWKSDNNDPVVNQLKKLYTELQSLFAGYPGNADQIKAEMEKIKNFLSENASKIEKICKNQGWTGKEPQNFMHLLVGSDGKVDSGAIFNDINNFIKEPNGASLDEAAQDINQLSWFMTNSP